MATATSTGSGAWSAAIWSGGSGAGGAPADNDAVVIAAGHSVLMDVDTSGWANGIAGLTIQGASETPAMLYFANGTNGHVKMKTGTYLAGTTGTNKGRLLANSDGNWATTTGLQASNTAVIELSGTSTVNCQYLDVKLYCTHPANPYVETYGAAYTCDQSTGVDTTNNILTFGSAPPANDTKVRVRSSGTLPGGLSADVQYYVQSKSGNTCKLSHVSGEATYTIVDLTSAGSGTLTMYDGHTSTSTKTLNVIQDITGDSQWAAGARLCIASLGPGTYDPQRDTFASATSSSVTITTNNVDSVLTPLARIYVGNRNVSVRQTQTTTASQPVFDYSTASGTQVGILDCEVCNTYQPGTQTTYYGYGTYGGTGLVLAGIFYGLSYAAGSGSAHTISGVVVCCGNGTNAMGCTVSGTVISCNACLYYGGSKTLTAIVSGSIIGCTTGVQSTTNVVVSGTIFGCNYSVNYGSNVTISGTILSANYGLSSVVSGLVSGSILACGYAIAGSQFITVTGYIYYCNRVFTTTPYIVLQGGTLGYDPAGNSCPSQYDIVHPTGDAYAVTCLVIGIGAKHQTTLLFQNRNSTGGVGNKGKFGFYFEDYDKSPGAYRALLMYGDLRKTACDGTGDAPSVDPDSGNGYCIEVYNVQSNCDVGAGILIFDRHRIWLAAGTYTITYKVQTTYAGITAGNLKLTARYLSDDSPYTLTETTDAPAISQRSDDTDWTQTLHVHVSPAVDSWVDLKMELMEYESGNEVYVWPTPAIT